MPESDPLQILLSHDRWATTQILGACGKLADDQFHRRFEIGPGSLHDTLTHIVAVMRTWTETLAGQELLPRLDTDGQRRTVDQLRSLHEAACQAIVAEAQRRPLDELSTRRLRDGRTVQIARGTLLTHVATHGTHHRAQCLNMLRQLGVRPLPPSSTVEWTWLSESGV